MRTRTCVCACVVAPCHNAVWATLLTIGIADDAQHEESEGQATQLDLQKHRRQARGVAGEPSGHGANSRRDAGRSECVLVPLHCCSCGRRAHLQACGEVGHAHAVVGQVLEVVEGTGDEEDLQAAVQESPPE